MDLLKKLQKEHDELAEKIFNLEKFINSKKFIEIDYRQQSLLLIQLPVMKSYSQILTERITLLEPL